MVIRVRYKNFALQKKTEQLPLKTTKFNGFMRISEKLPKEAVPSSFGTLNCQKLILKEAVQSSFEKPARRELMYIEH